MVNINPWGLFQGYYDQQNSELKDSREARDQALFEQKQADYTADAPLRASGRQLGVLQNTNAYDLGQVTGPAAVQNSMFANEVASTTQAAMRPQLGTLANFKVDTAVTDAATANLLARAGVTRAEDQMILAGHPLVRKAQMESKVLQSQMQQVDQLVMTGNMQAANGVMRQLGMEMQVVPGSDGQPTPMVRPVNGGDWQPWLGAASIPVFANYAKALNNETSLAIRQAIADAKARPAPPGLAIPGPAAAPAPVAPPAAMPRPIFTPQGIPANSAAPEAMPMFTLGG